MCKPMGCGNSSESVSNTRPVSPQLSEDYYSDRTSGRSSGYSDSGVSRMTRMSQATRANSNVKAPLILPPPLPQTQEPPKPTVFSAFLRVDDEILKLEEQCPGPRLVTIEAWIKYLESKQLVMQNDIIQLPLHMLDEDFDEEEEFAQYSRRARLENDVESLSKVRQLTESLNVFTDIQQSIKYEEFMANISRRYIENCGEVFREDILEHAQKRAMVLREMLENLRRKYNELDSLLALVGELRFSNPNEIRVDAELEISRQIRDKLGGAVEQWRTSAYLLRTSAKSALAAKESYDLIQISSSTKNKISAATDSRGSVLGAIIAFRCAQESLPQVEIQHVTNRQAVAVGHANEYMFTDIANPDRYQHTRRVLDAFHQGLNKSTIWLHETFTETLKKDFTDAENDVRTLALELREIRAEYFRSSPVGNQPYVPPPQTPSVALPTTADQGQPEK